MKQLIKLIILTLFSIALGSATNSLVGQSVLITNSRSAAIDKDGHLITWGRPSEIDLKAEKNIKSLHYGSSGTFLALRDDGTVFSFDRGKHGYLVPAGLKDVIDLAVLDVVSIALRSNGTIAVWGGRKILARLFYDIAKIDGSGSKFIYLTNDGTVSTCDVWGREVVKTMKIDGVVDIAAGMSYPLALKKDGTVVSWDTNGIAQFGIPSGLKGVTAIDAYNGKAIALLEDGSVVVWGVDEYGGIQASDLEFAKTLSGIVEVSVNYKFAAVKEDGSLITWGRETRNCDYQDCEIPSDVSVRTPVKNLDNSKHKKPKLVVDHSEIEILNRKSKESVPCSEIIGDSGLTEIHFRIENHGEEHVQESSASLTISGNTDGLNWISPWPIAEKKSGSSLDVFYPIQADSSTTDGLVLATIKFEQPSNRAPEPITIEIETRSPKK